MSGRVVQLRALLLPQAEKHEDAARKGQARSGVPGPGDPLTAPWAISGVAPGTAYSYARRAPESRLAPQAQAGLPPVPVHRAVAAGAVGQWPCAYVGRPWRRQVLPGFHPLRPVLQGVGAWSHLWH